MTPAFLRNVLIYVPTFNCQASIVSVLESIPPAIQKQADVLVIDNCSTDDTVKTIRRAQSEGRLSREIQIVQPSSNVGYARSQKLAYSLACRSENVKWVAMLHGDGQYPPALLALFEPWLSSSAGVVYGYRSRLAYPRLEETPFLTLMTIKILSVLESLVTGVWRREWHSGFVMHSTRFLNKVDLKSLTNTPHIDGQLLFVASAVGETAVPIAIYKRYKQLNRFEGAARRQYVIDVLKLMWGFRRNKNEYTRPMTRPCTPEEVADTEFRIIEE